MHNRTIFNTKNCNLLLLILIMAVLPQLKNENRKRCTKLLLRRNGTNVEERNNIEYIENL